MPDPLFRIRLLSAGLVLSVCLVRDAAGMPGWKPRPTPADVESSSMSTRAVTDQVSSGTLLILLHVAGFVNATRCAGVPYLVLKPWSLLDAIFRRPATRHPTERQPLPPTPASCLSSRQPSCLVRCLLGHVTRRSQCAAAPPPSAAPRQFSVGTRHRLCGSAASLV